MSKFSARKRFYIQKISTAEFEAKPCAGMPQPDEDAKRKKKPFFERG